MSLIGFDYDITPGYSGLEKVSLTDLIQNPDVAVQQVMSNVQNNALQAVIGFTVFEFSQRFTRKMLSRPINKVNSLIFTGKDAPLRGLGVRL